LNEEKAAPPPVGDIELNPYGETQS